MSSGRWPTSESNNLDIQGSPIIVTTSVVPQVSTQKGTPSKVHMGGWRVEGKSLSPDFSTKEGLLTKLVIYDLIQHFDQTVTTTQWGHEIIRAY